MSNAMKMRSASALSRAEDDDPSMLSLEVTRAGSFFLPQEERSSFWPADRADLSRIGDAIGWNTHLRSLFLINETDDALGGAIAGNGAFFKGFERNASIQDLHLVTFDLSTETGREVLHKCVASNDNIQTLTTFGCGLGNGGAGILASTVSNCTNLEHVALPHCSIDDAMLAEFVAGIRGNRKLLKLYLCCNNFGRAGCETLATLLQDPDCNLRFLSLDDNGLDDECASILANSLKGNEKLESLMLHNNDTITALGWESFAELLCNESSVNETYLSNHTLCEMGCAIENLPRSVSTPLVLNRLSVYVGIDAGEIAIHKIVRHHSHIDIGPFLEWDLTLLPTTVSWFDMAASLRNHEQRIKESIGAMKLSSMYQFVRAVPLMFVQGGSQAVE